ncbi:MAG: hypothetical protein LIP23_01245 [Planctomycetes bacterium]|nr:hypothetical protein [Planctomycetota bacterium]
MSAIENGIRAGNYLTFDLNGERHGIEAMKVVTIISHARRCRKRRRT